MYYVPFGDHQRERPFPPRFVPRPSTGTPIFSLPAELLFHVFAQLQPEDLSALAQTCRLLRPHAEDDRHWQRAVQVNVPGQHLRDPSPANTFRELFAMHYPHWFLTRHKIWFGNEPATGKLLIARYDSRRGRIEAYRLVAEQDVGLISNWTYDPNVSIHHFEPRVRLHVENPPIRLDPQRQHAVKVIGGRKVLNPETRMDIPSTGQGIFAELLLARQIHPDREMMYEQLWPPGTIPATQRVAGSPHVPQTGYDAPEKMSEVSEKAFRLRKWMQFTQSRQSLHVRMGEEVHNYSTLDPDLYTPTRTRPWRGIWVGDYSGHGPEFLLILQVPDVDPLPPDGPTPPTQDDEDRRIYSGELLAIKLTGDPNVPRGECSFMADLEPTNFVRTADEAPFRGARIVRSMGHIAATGFQNHEYVDSQLILISNDRIAQYWLKFGHISFYERVDVESLVNFE